MKSNLQLFLSSLTLLLSVTASAQSPATGSSIGFIVQYTGTIATNDFTHTDSSGHQDAGPVTTVRGDTITPEGKAVLNAAFRRNPYLSLYVKNLGTAIDANKDKILEIKRAANASSIAITVSINDNVLNGESWFTSIDNIAISVDRSHPSQHLEYSLVAGSYDVSNWAPSASTLSDSLVNPLYLLNLRSP